MTKKSTVLLPDDITFFHKVVDEVPGIVSVYNIHTGKYIYINRSLKKILGYDQKEWLEKGAGFVTSLVHPDDAKLIAKQNSSALKVANSKSYRGKNNEAIVSFEYRIRHKNGSWVHLKTDAVVFDRNEKGKVEHVMNISTDITKRKVAEMKAYTARVAAEELSKKAAVVLDTMSDACVILNKKFQYIYVNRRAEKLLGRKRAELIGKHIFDAMPESKNTPFYKDAKKALRTQKVISYDIYSEVLKRWLEIKYFPSPNGLAFYFSDTTGRKNAADARTRLAAIVENSNDAIVGKNLNSIITSWNKAAEEMFGYKAQDVIGKSIKITIPKKLSAQEDEIISKVKKGNRIEHFETLRMTKDGNLLDVSMTISPIKNDKGEIVGVSNITRDITEQKRLEKQRDDFISIATHELKTPVTSVKAYAQVLQSVFIKKADGKSVEYLEKMNQQLNRLTNLIEDLLDVNKIQTGQVAFRPSLFDMNTLVEEVVEDLQRTTPKHTLIKKLGKKGKKVYGDRDRTEQVLTNLISNAIKYSPTADKIIITSFYSKNALTICVQDFGIGIDEDKKDKVFEKFFRVSGPKNQTFPGMGLGLHISSEFVKRQGGRIWVESTKKGKGSTFCFSLPFKSSFNKSR